MDKELLKKLYIEKDFSQRAIAKELNCSHTRIRYYLKKYMISKNKTHVDLTNSKGTKLCPSCKIELLTSDFYKSSAHGRIGIGSWCKKCMNAQVVKRQNAYKAEYVKQKGGCCQSCGFNKYYGALDFHHKDPSEKNSGLSRMSKRASSPEIQAELAKCVLVCSNCHRMIHAGIIPCPELT